MRLQVCGRNCRRNRCERAGNCDLAHLVSESSDISIGEDKNPSLLNFKTIYLKLCGVKLYNYDKGVLIMKKMLVVILAVMLCMATLMGWVLVQLRKSRLR